MTRDAIEAAGVIDARAASDARDASDVLAAAGQSDLFGGAPDRGGRAARRPATRPAASPTPAPAAAPALPLLAEAAPPRIAPDPTPPPPPQPPPARPRPAPAVQAPLAPAEPPKGHTTLYLVIPYSDRAVGKSAPKWRPGTSSSFSDPNRALRFAETCIGRGGLVGALVARQTADIDLGDWSEPEIIGRFGRTPEIEG